MNEANFYPIGVFRVYFYIEQMNSYTHSSLWKNHEIGGPL